MARSLEASSGRDPTLSRPLSADAFVGRSPLSYARCLRAGTLGKAPQSVAMVDGECRLALVALQSHGVISHRNHIEQWCAASIQLASHGQ